MAQEQVLEEIMVTVQRRAERLRDVPVAVTALPSNQLVKQRINSLDALSAAAHFSGSKMPSVTIGEFN